ncbi:Potassium-transporting ATPase ATP-binding subunit [Candidatus Gugararchaeum adminiculabundum]|nr:Potassium-transporting ATPase ATP-binding subunit [Candidatus Gugararchaeum adminiculabundum]
MAIWHSLSVEDVCGKMGSCPAGLTEAEAAYRLEKFGPNEFERKGRTSVLDVFLRQFKSLIIFLLFCAAAISLYLNDIVEAQIIFILLITNALIGTYHEYNAESALKALKKLQTQEVNVLRGGQEVIVPTKDVVVGDIIILRAGDKIPADGRVLESVLLKTNESALTGESTPVLKSMDKLPEKNALADRTNMVYSGTFVSSGRGVMVAVETGSRTEIGKIYHQIISEHDFFPLQVKINRFSRQLAKYAIAAIALFFVFFGYLLGPSWGFNMRQVFELGVAQAVSFIPEGLPIVVTITLAIGVSSMAKKNALTRKLQAIETIGGVDVVCVDKTGTLTINKMSVMSLFISRTEYSVPEDRAFLLRNGKICDPFDVKGFIQLMETGILCNDSSADKKSGKSIGEPIEIALVDYAANFSLVKDKYAVAHPRKGEVQFDQRAKHMITMNSDGNSHLTFHLKGAPEQVVGMCSWIMVNGEEVSLGGADLEQITSVTDRMARQGLRVLAFAQKTNQPNFDNLSKGYALLGLIGFQDPLRHDVPDALRRARAAGIKVVMITGDHRFTAEAIAREAGILTESSHLVMTGEEIDSLSEIELDRRVPNVRVFARVTSEHKAKIVTLLKRQKHIVAMTGDGVNDAVALNDAHVGVSLGSGTDVAKEASDIVLTDDNFASLVDAIEEGRHSSTNIRKALKYLFATNTAEIFFLLAIMLSPFWAGSLLPLALLPIHVLYVNLVTDGACDVTLATERKENHLMTQKPSNFSGPLFSQDVKRFVIVSSIFLFLAVFAVYLYYLNRKVSLGLVRTAVFTTLAFFQLWSAQNARTLKESVFSIGFFSNRYLTAGIAVSIALQLCAIYSPYLNVILKTEPLQLFDWAIVLGASSSIFIFFEILKFFERRGSRFLAG